MKCLSLEEKNIIKDRRNPFIFKKEQDYTAMRDMRNRFRQEKETKAIKDRLLRDIKGVKKKKKKKIINQ